jgi:hypothetical protein
MLVAGGRSGVPVLGVPVSSECLSSECLSFLAFSRTGPPVGGMLVAGGLCRHELVRNGASCGAGKVHRLLRVPPTGSSIPKDDPQGRSPRTIPKDDPQAQGDRSGGLREPSGLHGFRRDGAGTGEFRHPPVPRLTGVDAPENARGVEILGRRVRRSDVPAGPADHAYAKPAEGRLRHRSERSGRLKRILAKHRGFAPRNGDEQPSRSDRHRSVLRTDSRQKVTFRVASRFHHDSALGWMGKQGSL